MKKLSYKIFAANFFTVVCVVILVWSLRYLLNRHFLDYVNQAEFERHTALVEQLEQEYQTYHGWDYLKSDRRNWMESILKAMRNSNAEPDAFFERNRMPGAGQEPYPEIGRHRRPPFMQMRGPGQRLFLLDENKNVITGRLPPPGNFILREITDNGKIVGWLGLRKRQQMETPPEEAFIRQQHGLLYMMGGVILLISLIISFLLARHLLTLIKRLKEGTQAISSRQFGARIVVRSKDELGQLAEDFNLMAQTLEKYEALRQQWMSDVSHELRTPLAVLRGEIEAILDGVREMSPERIESLHAEVLHVSKIVNDLHDLSLAETQSLSFRKEPIQPILILEDSLKSFKNRLEDREIDTENHLDASRNGIVLGDPDRLNQLFANLLENVVRYADSPGKLKIWQELSQTHLALYLEDSGPGVPLSSMAHLFDRFYRVDKSRSRELGGSGLGLSICKGIMETLGGQIHAENGSLGGLRIKMVFPLYKE